MLSIFNSLFSSVAHAQAAAPSPQGPSALESMIPFVVIFGVFYFLIIRPQAKKQKDHQKFLGELKRGDEVVTASGIFGRIEGMTEAVITLEVSDGVRIKFLRSQIAGSQKAATQTEGKA